MQTYTVYETPKPLEDRVKRAERMVFVRDGFSWMATLFAPLWMLVHRMWLALFLYIVLMIALNAALIAADVSPQWQTVAIIAVHLAIGFEAGSLRRWKLERRRWRMMGAVVGPSRIECERRFFQAWLGEEYRDDGSVRIGPPPRQVIADAPSPIAKPDAGPVGSEA